MSSTTISQTQADTESVKTTAKTTNMRPLANLSMEFLRWTVILVALFFALFPVVWIISASFNTNGSMVSQTLIPEGVTSFNELTVNYRELFNNEQIPFWLWMRNSIIISVTSTILILFITAMSAYAFSRFRFRGRRNLLLSIFLIQVFPNILAMVALYLMLLQIGKHIPMLGLDTYGGLIMIYLGGGMAMNIWLMKGFFDTIPRDIDESAMVDGATYWQSFWYLIFPLVRPIMAVVGLLSFVGIFNDFVLARIMLSERENWTLMVGMFSFVQGGEFSTEWGIFAAGSLIASVPVVILYLALQRFIVGGLTVGAVKG